MNNNKNIVSGDRFQHKRTKGIYEVIAVAVEEKTLVDVVVYQNENSREIWSRNKEEFTDGRFIKLP